MAAVTTGLHLRTFGTRKSLARHMQVTDLDDRDERLSPEPILQILMTARDEKLCRELQSEIERGTPTIAIVFGAAHMTAVAQFLYKFGSYKPVESEWMEVFEI
jgi:pheromone shutdown protein TraB